MVVFDGKFIKEGQQYTFLIHPIPTMLRLWLLLGVLLLAGTNSEAKRRHITDGEWEELDDEERKEDEELYPEDAEDEDDSDEDDV